MKPQNSFTPFRFRAFRALLLAGLLALPPVAAGAPVDLSETPISGASSMEIKPNILFIMDDSGSMDWDYLPDWAGGIDQADGNTVRRWSPAPHQSRNASFNGVAYNPAVTYQPPSYFDGNGGEDKTTYPSQTKANTDNWSKVKIDGYGIQSGETINLVGKAYYYTTAPGEFCTDRTLKKCATTRDADYPEPAYLRWCRTAEAAVALEPDPGVCQAVEIDRPTDSLDTTVAYNYPRMPAPRTSKLSVTGSGHTTVTSIQVNGKEILSTVASAATPSELAELIANGISGCFFGLSGGCQTVGFRAEASGSAVTIIAPDDTGAQPSPVKEGPMAVTTVPFGPPASNPVPGYVKYTPITPTTTSYPRAASRTDCIDNGTVCTYDEEMTNFANWYAYYRTRMQAMKTAASRSFSFDEIDNKYRIGYFSINNNTGGDFQNVKDFTGGHKKDWYDKLFNAKPIETADTPLRQALSQAGWLFAGKYTSLNGVSAVDPMQYYCQPNAAILSTDGYWNREAGFKLDGKMVGDQDGPGKEDRPQLDGGAGQRQKRTEQWYKKYEPQSETWFQDKIEQWQVRVYQPMLSVKNQEQKQVGTLQVQKPRWNRTEYQLQKNTAVERYNYSWTNYSEWWKSTRPLYRRTANRQAKEMQLQTRTKTQLQKQTGQLQRKPKALYDKGTRHLHQQIRQVMQRTSDNGGITWSAWTPVAECKEKLGKIQCQIASGFSAWYEVNACSIVAGGVFEAKADSDDVGTTYRTGVNCEYRYSPTQQAVPSSALERVESCQTQGSPGSPYTIPVQVLCPQVSSGQNTWQNVDACEVSATVDCQYAWSVAVDVPDGEGCTNNYSSGPTSYTIGKATKCLTNQWSQWKDTYSTCKVSATVDCSYRITANWHDVTSCTEQAAVSGGTIYDVIQSTECGWGNFTSWYNVTTPCTAGETSSTKTECTYGSWSSETKVTQCFPAGQSGSYYLPGVQCRPVSESTYVDHCEAYQNCTAAHYWSNSWSNVNECTANAASGETAAPGKVQCRYSSTTYSASYSPCAETTPNAPPQETSVFPVGGSSSVPSYRKCAINWTGTWSNASTTCVDGNDMKCRYTWGNLTNVPTDSCKEIPPSTGPTYDVLNPVRCSLGFSAYQPVDKCPNPLPPDTQCRVDNLGYQDITPANHPDFDPDHRDPGKQYTTRLIRNWSPPVPAATADNPSPSNAGYCTPGVSYGGDGADKSKVITCQTAKPAASAEFLVSACPRDGAPSTEAGEGPGAENNFVKTICRVKRTGPVIDAACGKQPDGEYVNHIPGTAENNYEHTYCGAGEGVPTSDTLADVAEYYFMTDLRTEALGNCTGAPVSSGGGLELTYDVCSNAQGKQAMITYTLGLGASGVMQFEPGYKTATSGDYYSIAHETLANPDKGICSWQTHDSTCNWPKPASGKQTNIDDLWHAAVNGRGTYFSAENPSAMAAGISAALQDVTVKDGSLASATISNRRLSKESDVSAFQVSFSSGTWKGEVQQYLYRETDAGVTKTPGWAASSLLDGRLYTEWHPLDNPKGRKIRVFDSDVAANKLKPFVWDSLSATEKAYFQKPHIATLSQLCGSGSTCLPSMDHDAVQGENLVNFLRGDRANEGAANDVSKYYRQRASVLGDIVSSEATYVRKSPWSYADNGYSNFKLANVNRAGMVYVGANDGMLHAFDAVTGQEAWAFVPSFIMPRLYLLADKNYSSHHRYFVDGTPVMGDICVSNCAPTDADPVWKTILVGGVNLGGRGYYALDITDPANPKGLWEFTSADDVNLGYTYGNPVITKLKNGAWVVLVASGYNNVSPGDGKGRLFVLDAATGAQVNDFVGGILTSAGSEETPNGLAKISAWANYPDYNNTAERVYGGDLLGNLWRFDINDTIPPDGREAMVLATLKDGSGNAQPITTVPQLGMVWDRYPVVFVGTGQLLGLPDTLNTGTQSLYAIKDTLGESGHGNPRAADTFVKQTMTSGICPKDHSFCTEGQAIVTVTKNEVDWDAKNGWYVDFPKAGERVNTDINLIRGTLEFVTNRPQTGACVPAGVSTIYWLDYKTGGYVGGTENVGGQEWGDHFSNSPTDYETSTGQPGSLVSGDDASLRDTDTPHDATGEKERRISWRGLIVE
jgi:Tfp pilus tip-associated adhesin PilY1